MTGQLDVLAEVSVALLGFSGLLVTLGRSSFPEAGVFYRVVGLLGSASLALFASLLPIVNVPIELAGWAVGSVSAAFLLWLCVPFLFRGATVGSSYALTAFMVVFGGSVIAGFLPRCGSYRASSFWPMLVSSVSVSSWVRCSSFDWCFP